MNSRARAAHSFGTDAARYHRTRPRYPAGGSFEVVYSTLAIIARRH
ncbi:MAG: hypothetical protein J2O48_09660 [Solirubrobacterales bacterium]|nr:hypothetical protein [Solirubrobacterales bacterium]